MVMFVKGRGHSEENSLERALGQNIDIASAPQQTEDPPYRTWHV